MRDSLIGLLTLFATIGTFAVHAQPPGPGMGVDQMFEVARGKAFAGDYAEARTIAYDILQRSPDYHDVRILVARTYAWQGERGKARDELAYVLERSPDYRDALSASIDVERWDGRYARGLELTGQALGYYPDDPVFLKKKAELLASLERYDEARAVLRKAGEIDPDSADIDALSESIDDWRPHPNRISAGFYVNEYSEFFDHDPIAYLQYGRETPWGTVIGRVNYRDRFGSSGAQGEIDFYPAMAEGIYGYLNYGYSSSTSLFPRHRYGAEIYANLPRAFEASLGLRHLDFDSSNVTIYTGSLGKYFGNYLLSVRPYVTPGDTGTSVSGAFSLTRFFGSREQYLKLRGNYGESVQEHQFQSAAAQGVTLESWSIGMAGQWEFLPYTYLSGSFDVGEEELLFAPGDFVEVYSLSIGISHRF